MSSIQSLLNPDSPTSPPKEKKSPFIVAYFDPQIRAKDPSGRTLDDILSYSDDQISAKHDFIQYLFPLPEESMVNSRAPLITRSVYDAFRDRVDLRAELLEALRRMLKFYGFNFSAAGPGEAEAKAKVVPAQNFRQKAKHSWRRRVDHNHLRLTRMIRCLRVLSCEREARALYCALLKYDEDGVVRDSTKMFWARAAERPLWLPPDEAHEDAEGIRWLREVSEVTDEEGERVEGESEHREAQTVQSNGEVKEGGEANVDVVDKASASNEETNQPAGSTDEGKVTGSGNEQVDAKEAETEETMGEGTAEGETSKHP